MCWRPHEEGLAASTQPFSRLSDSSVWLDPGASGILLTLARKGGSRALTCPLHSAVARAGLAEVNVQPSEVDR